MMIETLGFMLFYVLMILSALWVLRDAMKHKMGHSNSKSPGPVKITVGCLLLWIICFPYYLIRRNTFIKSAKEFPLETKLSAGHYAALAVSVCLALVMSFSSATGSDLPTCGSPEVEELTTQIINDMGYQGSLSDLAQVKYEMANETRLCRGIADSGDILNFTVEWYSEAKEQFYVEFY